MQVEEYVNSTRNSHPFANQLFTFGNRTPVMSPRFYKSAGSVDGTTTTIAKISSLPTFKEKFPFMESFNIEIVFPGQAGTMQMVTNKPYLLYGAERKPTYFDAQIMTPTHLACYRDKDRVPGMKHSGDLNDSGHFMHSVTCNRFVQNVYAASAVGYSHNNLKQTMYAVPFSLEYATIGDSMMIAPLIFHMDDRGFVEWYVPRTCLMDGRVNTGEYSVRFKCEMTTVAQNWRSEYMAYMTESEKTNVPASENSTHSEANVTNESIDKIVFVQDGIQDISRLYMNCLAMHYVQFGTTLRLATSFCPKSAPEIILPILSGEAHGHAALALGQKASMCIDINSSGMWQASANNCSTIIVHATDGPEWYEGVMQAQLHRTVGIMIVHISKNLSDNHQTRSIEMTSLSLCCVRLMSGVSIILILTPNGNAYFYRGAITILPVCPPTPSFADIVDINATICAHINRNTPLSIGTFVSNAFKQVITENDILDPCASIEPFFKMAINGGPKWDDIMAQLSVCLSTAEIENFKDVLRNKVIHLEQDETKDMRKQLQKLISALQQKISTASTSDDMSVYIHDESRAISHHKKLIRDSQIVYREFLGRIDQLCSYKVVSARKVGLQQAQRRMTIQQNVSRAHSMTTAQLAEELMDTTWGFAVARIDPIAVGNLLQEISSCGMNNFLQHLAMPMQVITNTTVIDINTALTRNALGFHTAPKCPMLDAECVQILMEMHQNDHILSSTTKSLTFCLQDSPDPYLVLPLYNDASEMDGKYVDFMNKADNDHIASYRITLRGMLCSLKARYPIKANSADLTFGIQMIVLSLMHSMVSKINDVSQFDEESTGCQMLRSLMYLWGTFAASGKSPVTFAYQLTQPGAKIVQPKLRGEWTIYAIVAHIYPYTKLPLDAFKSNIRILLVHALYRSLLKPVIENMQTASKISAKAFEKKHIEYRNRALRWNYAACAILSRIDKKKISCEEGVSAAFRLLDAAPTHPTYTSKQLSKTLGLIITDSPVDWILVRHFIACATIKRSGCFAAHKKARTLAAIIRCKVHMCHQLNMNLPGDVVTFKHQNTGDISLLFCGKLKIDDEELYIYKRPNSLSNITVQNEDAYKTNNLQKMKGDAELTRIAWRMDCQTLISCCRCFLPFASVWPLYPVKV